MNKSAVAVAIIAVKDVKSTTKMLARLFGWQSSHGGSEFDILMSPENVPALMLHEFQSHEHSRFKGINKKTKGVGQSLYVFVDNIEAVYKKVKKLEMPIIEEIFLNENSEAQEFTFQIEEGYQFSVCEDNSWLYYNVSQ